MQQVFACETRAKLTVDRLQVADGRRLEVAASGIPRQFLQRLELREPGAQSHCKDPNVRCACRSGSTLFGLVVGRISHGSMFLTV